eukprot:1471923-Rhodomonas_salina.1
MLVTTNDTLGEGLNNNNTGGAMWQRGEYLIGCGSGLLGVCTVCDYSRCAGGYYLANCGLQNEGECMPCSSKPSSGPDSHVPCNACAAGAELLHVSTATTQQCACSP